MRMRKLRLFLPLLCFFLSGTALFGQQQPKLDRCFPDSTQIYVSVTNVRDLADHWRQTMLSESLSDPKFDKFRESIRTQIEEAWPNRLGLDFPTSRPSRPVKLAGLIAVPGKSPASRHDERRRQLRRNQQFPDPLIRQATSKQSGVATKERIAVGSQQLKTVLTFLPTKNPVPEPSITSFSAVPHRDRPKVPCETLLRKLAGDKQPSFPRVRNIKRSSRCAADSTTKDAPQISFFGNIGAGEAIPFADPNAAKTRSPFSVLAKQGFDGIKGVGGTIDFSTKILKWSTVSSYTFRSLRQFPENGIVHQRRRLARPVDRQRHAIHRLQLERPDRVQQYHLLTSSSKRKRLGRHPRFFETDKFSRKSICAPTSLRISGQLSTNAFDRTI